MNFELTYRRFSERSILVEWPQEISEIILKDVLLYKNSLLSNYGKCIVQVNTAYNSILISYKTTIDNVNDEIIRLKTHYVTKNTVERDSNRLFKIPVCYDEDYGVDLVAISEETQLSISEIIQRHTQPIYTVFFIGFLPGFLYLGGLDKRLHFPRKKSPRLQIKKGAVAIGGQQTGIYPNASPGGWNIIGNSPIPLFLPKKKQPCFAKPGDKIKFVAVSKLEYDNILLKTEKGLYAIESEVIDG